MKVDIENMPVAIKDDCLKDTIATVSFRSDYSIEHLEDLVLEALTSVFGPEAFSKIPLVLDGVAQEGKWFWANNQYRFMFDGNTIQFNIVSQYSKWPEYSKFIHQALSALEHKITYKQVSVRYVSFFPNDELATMIDGTLKMEQLDAFPGAQYRFMCSARNIAQQVVASAEVQLSDRYEMQDGSNNSIIDIRVWRDCRGEQDDAFKSLDLVHDHQKHLFFLLLSEPFYNKLKI